MWEALAAQRPIILTLNVSSSTEWQHNTPPRDHTYSQLPILTNYVNMSIPFISR